MTNGYVAHKEPHNISYQPRAAGYAFSNHTSSTKSMLCMHTGSSGKRESILSMQPAAQPAHCNPVKSMPERDNHVDVGAGSRILI